MNKYIRYFKKPLHGLSSSTAYRLPNSLVHLPVIIMVPYLGIFICGTEARSFLPVYFIIALYVARDMSVMSYRNFFIPVGIWGVFIHFIIFKREIASFLTLHLLPFSMNVSIGISSGFILYILLYVNNFLKWQD